MNTKSITLGDGTIVLITYDANNRVLSVSSQQPSFVFLFGPEEDVYVGNFTDNAIATVTDLFALIASLI